MTLTDFFKNWKTTGVAVVIAIAGIFRVFFPSQEVFINKLSEAIIVFGTAVAAFLAKDADKSGTTAQPRE